MSVSSVSAMRVFDISGELTFDIKQIIKQFCTGKSVQIDDTCDSILVNYCAFVAAYYIMFLLKKHKIHYVMRSDNMFDYILSKIRRQGQHLHNDTYKNLSISDVSFAITCTCDMLSTISSVRNTNCANLYDIIYSMNMNKKQSNICINRLLLCTHLDRHAQTESKCNNQTYLKSYMLCSLSNLADYIDSVHATNVIEKLKELLDTNYPTSKDYRTRDTHISMSFLDYHRDIEYGATVVTKRVLLNDSRLSVLHYSDHIIRAEEICIRMMDDGQCINTQFIYGEMPIFRLHDGCVMAVKIDDEHISLAKQDDYSLFTFANVYDCRAFSLLRRSSAPRTYSISDNKNVQFLSSQIRSSSPLSDTVFVFNTRGRICQIDLNSANRTIYASRPMLLLILYFESIRLKNNTLFYRIKNLINIIYGYLLTIKSREINLQHMQASIASNDCICNDPSNDTEIKQVAIKYAAIAGLNPCDCFEDRFGKNILFALDESINSETTLLQFIKKIGDTNVKCAALLLWMLREDGSYSIFVGNRENLHLHTSESDFQSQRAIFVNLKTATIPDDLSDLIDYCDVDISTFQ